MSEADTDRLRWTQIFALRTLHEATLQALIGARNYAVLQLLRERNDLLSERYWAMASFLCVSPLSHHYFVAEECPSAVQT